MASHFLRLSSTVPVLIKSQVFPGLERNCRLSWQFKSVSITGINPTTESRRVTVERNLSFYWFCLTFLCDWSQIPGPLSQPIKCKTKTNHDLVIRVFPRFCQFTCFSFEFSWFSEYLPFFLMKIEKRCKKLSYLDLIHPINCVYHFLEAALQFHGLLQPRSSTLQQFQQLLPKP